MYSDVECSNFSLLSVECRTTKGVCIEMRSGSNVTVLFECVCQLQRLLLGSDRKIQSRIKAPGIGSVVLI